MSPGDVLLEVRGLRVRKGGVDLLDVPALDVRAGETLSLIGPNGAGKSTLLLALSAIEPPAAGELLFRGERVPAGAALAYRRRIAMVFQEPLLFDTTVFENVASGLRLRGVAKREIARRVAESLERFRIAELAGRSARTLSGGEAQRTSLARALAIEPEILLLDEPFAALDPLSREALLEDLARTLRDTGTTTVFVTHDRSEAERIADRIAVLERGRVRQIGGVGEVLRRPADAFVASFVGVENLLRVTLASAGLRGGGFAVLVGDGGGGEGGQAAGRELEIGGSAYGMKPGSDGLLCVRPEDVVLASPARPAGANRLWGRVVSVLPQGPFHKVTVDCGVRVVAAVSGHVARELEVRPGCALAVELRPSDLYVLPRA